MNKNERNFRRTEEQKRDDGRVGIAVDDEAKLEKTTTEVAAVPRQLAYTTRTCRHVTTQCYLLIT